MIIKSEDIQNKFKHQETVRFKNTNILYRPWHMDIFKYDNALYAIVQTNQGGGDICLAKSTDGVHFRLFDKPLVTNKTCGGIEIYKPTAFVYNGKLYVYYTFQSPNRLKFNMMYVTGMSVEELLEKLV